MFDPHAVSLEWYKEAYLAGDCLGKVALGKLEDGEEDDGDDGKDREENPVELVEKSQVWGTFDNEAAVGVSDQYKPLNREDNNGVGGCDVHAPEHHGEEEGVEVDS